MIFLKKLLVLCNRLKRIFGSPWWEYPSPKMNRCHEYTLKGSICKKRKMCSGDYCSTHSTKNECGICLNTISNKFTLECNHSFCSECVFTWLCCQKNVNSCPLCRTETSSFENASSMQYGLTKNIVQRCIQIVVPLSHLINDDSIMEYLSIEKKIFYELTEFEKQMEPGYDLMDRLLIDSVKKNIYVKSSNVYFSGKTFYYFI